MSDILIINENDQYIPMTVCENVTSTVIADSTVYKI